jgi:PAS domain S-box-containing protein
MGKDLVGRRKDGSEVPIEAGFRSVPLKDGVAQIAYINDITMRKQAEAALRKSEQRLRSLVETTSDMVWEIDENCAYTYVSPQVRTILGYEPEEVIGKTPFDILDPEEARRTRDYLQRMAKGRSAFTCYESATPHRSGHPVVIEVSGVPFFDDDGALRGYRGIARDITERKKADQALRESEASLGRAQQLAQIGNWETDMATGELHWSREVYRIFQIPPGEPLTRELFSARVHPEDRAAVSKAAQVAAETGAPYSIEHRIVLPDGTERYVREHAEVMHDEHGAVRLVGTVQDITEYKRLEDQLRQAQRMEAVGRLAGGVVPPPAPGRTCCARRCGRASRTAPARCRAGAVAPT